MGKGTDTEGRRDSEAARDVREGFETIKVDGCDPGFGWINVPQLEISYVKKLLEIQIPAMPVQWKRMGQGGLGGHRFKPEDLRIWQQRVADTALEEIALAGVEAAFPARLPLFVSIQVLYHNIAERDRAPDWDNIAKGICDALSKVVFVDDNPKYVRRAFVNLDVAPDLSMVGTYITIYAL